ncbi:MAG: hypothetical protein KKA90_04680 [Nanoarchaeota archaeon]|nr:hypothetical protein [Nanoarchaeota archaeon]
MDARLVVLLLLVVLIPGCTGIGDLNFTTPTQGSGLIVDYFAPDFVEISAGETVHFDVRLKNTGSVPVSEGEMYIHGLDWEAFGVGDQLIGPGFLSNCQYFESIQAADPTAGTSGGVHTCSIPKTAPTSDNLPQGGSFIYYPKLRVLYSYATETVKEIVFASADDVQSLAATGAPLSSGTISTTNGPVTIGVNVKGPIHVLEGGRSVSFPVEIVVNNVGGGTVCKDRYSNCGDPENWGELVIDITVPGGFVHNCGTRTIGLYKGKTNSFTCTIQATGLGWTVGPIAKTIEVGSTYGYFVDTETAIRVNWVQSAGITGI